jgi:sec-independent protein translocase protein TatC
MATTGNVDQEQEPLLTFDGFSTDDENDPNAMSLVDHLEELRWRIFKCLIAIVVFTVVAFIFRSYVLQFLEAPLPKHFDPIAKNGSQLITTDITGGFTAYLLISVASGIILSLPVLLYQTWAFIAPGLYEREKKYAVPFIFIGIVLFLLGVSVGYVVIRFPVEWLISFAASDFVPLITANSYLTFAAFFILVFGLVFELPLVITFMAKIGMVNVKTLREKRPAAHVGMWIAATFLTPGADLYSPIILGVCMSFLYELTIIFIHFAVKDETRSEVA